MPTHNYGLSTLSLPLTLFMGEKVPGFPHLHNFNVRVLEGEAPNKATTLVWCLSGSDQGYWDLAQRTVGCHKWVMNLIITLI